MSEVRDDLRYTDSHEWVRLNEDGDCVVGITDHAQSALGDLVFVELPEPGSPLTVGDACAVVESVKAASDIYAPLTGEVVAVNDQLADSPELVNEQPYDDGWLFSIRPDDDAALSELLEPSDYEELLDE